MAELLNRIYRGLQFLRLSGLDVNRHEEVDFIATQRLRDEPVSLGRAGAELARPEVGGPAPFAVRAIRGDGASYVLRGPTFGVFECMRRCALAHYGQATARGRDGTIDVQQRAASLGDGSACIPNALLLRLMLGLLQAGAGQHSFQFGEPGHRQDEQNVGLAGCLEFEHSIPARIAAKLDHSGFYYGDRNSLFS